jgi:hypothetical protein
VGNRFGRVRLSAKSNPPGKLGGDVPKSGSYFALESRVVRAQGRTYRYAVPLTPHPSARRKKSSRSQTPPGNALSLRLSVLSAALLCEELRWRAQRPLAERQGSRVKRRRALFRRSSRNITRSQAPPRQHRPRRSTTPCSTKIPLLWERVAAAAGWGNGVIARSAGLSEYVLAPS